MRRGRIVAVEGPSGSGKTTLSRRLERTLGAMVLPETYRTIRPRPSLSFETPRELERLELRLLAAEAHRWRTARTAAASDRLVILDTAPYGPLTYTYGLALERLAPSSAVRTVARRARTLVRRGQLGPVDRVFYLDVPRAERDDRAVRASKEHPARLFARHQRVARHERALWLGAWRDPFSVRRVPVRRGERAGLTADRIAAWIGSLGTHGVPSRAPAGPVHLAQHFLELERALPPPPRRGPGSRSAAR